MTFYNVTITAQSPHDAYTALCNALARSALEWQTDTYYVERRGTALT